MLSTIESILNLVNAMTPISVAGLLGVIIFLMVRKKGPIQQIQTNHLLHVQGALDRIVTSNDRLAAANDKQLEVLHDIRTDIGYVKGKLDK